MDHSAAHRDRVLEHLISDTELLERMNPTRRERKINRASTDDIAFARIGAALIKINLVSAPSQVRAESPPCQATADEGEFWVHRSGNELAENMCDFCRESVSHGKSRNVQRPTLNVQRSMEAGTSSDSICWICG